MYLASGAVKLPLFVLSLWCFLVASLQREPRLFSLVLQREGTKRLRRTVGIELDRF